MTKRRKRVQVGWYCDHEDEKREAPYKGSHMSSHGRYRKKKGWLETYPQPETVKALNFLDYHDPAKAPHCPRAVPAYIYIDTTEVAQ